MQTRHLMVIAAWSLMLAVAAPLHAQETHLRVNIPFEFNVANRTFPAGIYTLDHIPSRSALQIHQLNGHGNAMVPVSSQPSAEMVREGKLLFRRYGETYFLSEVWGAFESTGSKLFPSKTELQIAKAGTKAQDYSLMVRR